MVLNSGYTLETLKSLKKFPIPVSISEHLIQLIHQKKWASMFLKPVHSQGDYNCEANGEKVHHNLPVPWVLLE